MEERDVEGAGVSFDGDVRADVHVESEVELVDVVSDAVELLGQGVWHTDIAQA